MEKKGRDAKHGYAAELLSNWRAAERDTASAKAAADVAALAIAAVGAAEEAAVETEAAAQAATEAVIRATTAAERAKKAASQAAELARIAFATAEGDHVRADLAVTKAELAESEARDQFHVAEEQGFPGEST